MDNNRASDSNRVATNYRLVQCALARSLSGTQIGRLVDRSFTLIHPSTVPLSSQSTRYNVLDVFIPEIRTAAPNVVVQAGRATGLPESSNTLGLPSHTKRVALWTATFRSEGMMKGPDLFQNPTFVLLGFWILVSRLICLLSRVHLVSVFVCNRSQCLSLYV